jgi:DNA polymerase/3'-5' exonuclease PolX
MMKWMWAAVAALSLVSGAMAQSTADAERARQSTEVMNKVQKLDLMNMVLPLLFTKEQYRQLLPAIEKARENVRQAEKQEADELKKLEPSLTAALKEAEEKGEVPKAEVLNEARSTLRRLGTARMLISQMNTENVMEAFMKVANAGQRKTAANSLRPAEFGITTKPEEMTEEAKLRIFVREILLHPLTYDVMRKLSI